MTMDRWYEQAGIRNGVRRIFHEESEAGKVFFPHRLVPYLSHEAVRDLPAERHRELAVRHLYQFLLSTAHLETRVVNRGAELIANGRSGIELPMSSRLDAFKVYCDEGYHSLYSLDLADQIGAVTGVPVPRWNYGGFVDQLADAVDRTLPDHPELAVLLQVVVFETLITAVLNEIPHDDTVVTTVRETVRDHAKDEGRHHHYFTGFFHELWHQLDAPTRVDVAFAMPALIRSCLLWDVEPVRSSLVLAGLDDTTATAVVRDCYGGDPGNERIRAICRASLRMCESAGVLAVPGAAEQFAAHGLIDGSGR
ncbi:diiron oxygenase [Kutzneria kofuensis]|uniref:Para-aminobenzoate N-oxygenase AurF n=1 Tax=Kutzneria kofuensis TaxID=103725 RepID=A0A7W9NK31_9PSEU|nr:diiron oxygenase [Kutzneria kofuensis]MBB5895565.1 hypothetical protein [Kutzneria kofuensis]